MRLCNKKPRQDGFTLTELLTVLALLSILMVLAVPSFSTFISRYSLSTISNDFLSSLILVRSEALKRGRRVDMIPINGNWQNGWIVFVDQNNDQLLDSIEELIQQHEAMPVDIQVTKAIANRTTCNLSSGIPFTQGNKTYIAYTGNGFSRQNSGGFLAGSMLFINGQHQRCLVISSQGRPRITGQ